MMERYNEMRVLVNEYKLGVGNDESLDKIESIVLEEVGEISEVFGVDKKTVRSLKWHELALLDEMLNGADRGHAYVDGKFVDWAMNNLPMEIVENINALKDGGYDMALYFDKTRSKWLFLWNYILDEDEEEEKYEDPNEGLWSWSDHF